MGTCLQNCWAVINLLTKSALNEIIYQPLEPALFFVHTCGIFLSYTLSLFM